MSQSEVADFLCDIISDKPYVTLNGIRYKVITFMGNKRLIPVAKRKRKVTRKRRIK